MRLKIYNILGQEVRTLVNKQMPAGNYDVQWDGTDDFGNMVSSGIYIYQLNKGNGFINTKKLVLLR